MPSAERRRQFIDTRARAHASQVPAVSSVRRWSSNLPYGGSNTSREFWPEGVTLEQARRSLRATTARIAAGYLETMKIPILAGRGFTDADRADGPPVAVVSRILADRYWPTGRSDRPPLPARGGRRVDHRRRRRRATSCTTGSSSCGAPRSIVRSRRIAPFAQASSCAPWAIPSSVAGDVRRAVLPWIRISRSSS